MRNLKLAGANFAVINEEFKSDAPLKLVEPADIVLCGYSAFSESDLGDEISLLDGCLAEVAKVSGKYSAVVVCGLKTHLNGYKQLSAAVAARGKVVDMVRRTQNIRGDVYENSDKIKIYKTQKLSVALLLDTDILLAKNWERVSENCDVVVSVGLEFSDEEADFVGTLCRLYRLPYLLVTQGGIWWGEP